MSKMIPFEDAKKVYDKILAIDLSKIEVVTRERLYQKDFAQRTRTFLKGLGISSRDVSVKCADGAMCYWIIITLPYIDRGKTWIQVQAMTEDERDQWFTEGRVMEDVRNDATRHMRDMVNIAFPGCVDRSDPMTDYYDFMFSVY